MQQRTLFSGSSVPASARDLRVREIGLRDAIALNQTWHSVLPDISYFVVAAMPKHVAYSAEYDGTRYAVAIWSSPSAANRMTDGWKLLELRRLAISEDAPKFTASRMLGVMARAIREKYPDVLRLISYQATEKHDGTIYRAAGWTAENESKSRPWHSGSQRDTRQMRSSVVRWARTLRVKQATTDDQSASGGATPTHSLQ